MGEMEGESEEGVGTGSDHVLLYTHTKFSGIKINDKTQKSGIVGANLILTLI